MQDPISVIKAITGQANRDDVPDMLSLFADGALIRFEPPLPPPVRPAYQGKEALRDYFQLLVNHGFHVDPRDFRASGNEVTWRSTVSADLFRRLGVEKAESESRAVVVGGRVQSIVIHYSPESLQKMHATLAREKALA